ncbi:Hypothetical predicted protein, partial [Podarcis lilfordi]
MPPQRNLSSFVELFLLIRCLPSAADCLFCKELKEERLAPLRYFHGGRSAPIQS